jgi:hypothetical protein
MLTIRYHRGKLAMIAFALFAFAAFVMFLFLDPDYHVGGLFGLLLNGSLGHFLTVPVLEFGLAITGFRVAWLAAGETDAIQADRDGLTVTTVWRSQHAPWSDVMQVRAIEKRTRRRKYWVMVVDRREGSTIRLSLGAVDLHKNAYHDLVQALTQLQLDAMRAPAETVKRRAAPTPAPAAPVQSAPPVRGFGRKAV